MLETLLFFALGFAVAGLVALAMLPAVWARALRLTRRRIEVDVPLSMAEVRAGRDEERAAAAIELRRVERALEAERERRHRLMAELGRADLMRRRLVADAASKAAHIREVETEMAALRAVILQSEEKFSLSRAEIAAARVAIAAREDNGEQMRRERDNLRMEADALRTELAAERLKAQALEDNVLAARREAERAVEAGIERDGKLAIQALELGRKEAAIASLESQLATAQERLSALERSLGERASEDAGIDAAKAEFERRLGALTTQLQKADSALAERSARLAMATAREKELTHELETLRRQASQTAGDLLRGADEARDERAHIEAQLEAARADRALLVKEVALLKKEATEGWKSIEIENQVLRIEIAKIAAMIADDAAARRGVIVSPPPDLDIANDEPGVRKARRKSDERSAD